MRKPIFSLIVSFLGMNLAFAQGDDVSLIGSSVESPAASEVSEINLQTNQEFIETSPHLEKSEPDPSVKDGFALMKDFVSQEHAKVKEIRLLNLDLERVNLELKRQKLLSEIKGLNQSHEPLASAGSSDHPFKEKSFPNIKVVYLACSKNFKEAILNVDGALYRLKEKEKVNATLTLKSIIENAVIIESPDGQEIQIPFQGTNNL